MTTVRIISAAQLGDSAVATVVLDEVVTVTGVRVIESPYTGRTIAEPPRRPHGDHRLVLAWSDAVAIEVAAAIGRALEGGTVAMVGEAA